MISKKLPIVLLAALSLILGFLPVAAPAFAASKEKEEVLHIFGGKGGAYPMAGLIFDAAGNMYGTTQQGGADDAGTVFKLTPGANGKWTKTVIHTFGGKGGAYPQAGLIVDALGNLYGTTFGGGTDGAGTVFELTPGANGEWTKTVIHTFKWNGGAYPLAGLIFDAAGNMYGTTFRGGTSGVGTVFQLSPGANGKWTEAVLHSFKWTDGAYPQAGLVLDAAGNLYGTTEWAGAYDGGGSVFRLAPGANGKWTETVLHSFHTD